jgi:hypothetical protein
VRYTPQKVRSANYRGAAQGWRNKIFMPISIKGLTGQGYLPADRIFYRSKRENQRSSLFSSGNFSGISLDIRYTLFFRSWR